LTRTPRMSRYLLALCAVLYAAIAGIYLIMYNTGPDGTLTLHGFNDTVLFLNRLTLAAGVCTIAAGIGLAAQAKSWLLFLNGLALSAYGLIPLVWKGPLGFDFLALPIMIMALAFGILALATARTLRRHVADEWLFGLAVAGSLGFALAFLALANRWIQLERRAFHPSAFLWLCAYFGFSAVCMLLLSLRLPRSGPSDTGPWANFPQLGNPKNAH
jgi:hypothetical protein